MMTDPAMTGPTIWEESVCSNEDVYISDEESGIYQWRNDYPDTSSCKESPDTSSISNEAVCITENDDTSEQESDDAEHWIEELIQTGDEFNIEQWLEEWVDERDADCEELTEDTPLHSIMAQRPSVELINNLISSMREAGGEDCIPEELVDSQGRTPLHVAIAESCDISVIQRLMVRNRSAQTADSRYRYPLHYACDNPNGIPSAKETNNNQLPHNRNNRQNMLDIVCLLVFAFPEAVAFLDKGGNTPIQLAVKHNAGRDLIRVLEHCNDKKTVMDILIKNKHEMPSLDDDLSGEPVVKIDDRQFIKHQPSAFSSKGSLNITMDYGKDGKSKKSQKEQKHRGSTTECSVETYASTVARNNGRIKKSYTVSVSGSSVETQALTESTMHDSPPVKGLELSPMKIIEYEKGDLAGNKEIQQDPYFTTSCQKQEKGRAYLNVYNKWKENNGRKEQRYNSSACESSVETQALTESTVHDSRPDTSQESSPMQSIKDEGEGELVGNEEIHQDASFTTSLKKQEKDRADLNVYDKWKDLLSKYKTSFPKNDKNSNNVDVIESLALPDLTANKVTNNDRSFDDADINSKVHHKWKEMLSKYKHSISKTSKKIKKGVVTKSLALLERTESPNSKHDDNESLELQEHSSTYNEASTARLSEVGYDIEIYVQKENDIFPTCNVKRNQQQELCIPALPGAEQSRRLPESIMYDPWERLTIIRKKPSQSIYNRKYDTLKRRNLPPKIIVFVEEDNFNDDESSIGPNSVLRSALKKYAGCEYITISEQERLEL